MNKEAHGVRFPFLLAYTATGNEYRDKMKQRQELKICINILYSFIQLISITNVGIHFWLPYITFHF